VLLKPFIERMVVSFTPKNLAMLGRLSVVPDPLPLGGGPPPLTV
jgi:hypothetical protein